jgi:hypothetical protein
VLGNHLPFFSILATQRGIHNPPGCFPQCKKNAEVLAPSGLPDRKHLLLLFSID